MVPTLYTQIECLLEIVNLINKKKKHFFNDSLFILEPGIRTQNHDFFLQKISERCTFSLKN